MKYNWLITAVVIVLIVITAAPSLLSSLDTGAEQLTDEGQCEAAGGYWNATPEQCDVSVSNTTDVSYRSLPLGGLFADGSVLFLLAMAFILFPVIGVIWYKRR